MPAMRGGATLLSMAILSITILAHNSVLHAQSLPANNPPLPASSASIDSFAGSPLRSISFQGLSSDRLQPIIQQLPLTVGKPMRREQLQLALRQLYASGLFETIEVTAQPGGEGVALLFRVQPRLFIGRVDVSGARGTTLNSELQRACQLVAGTRFTQAKLDHAIALMRATMAQNGYPGATIEHHLLPFPDDQIVDLAFVVSSGIRARVGNVDIVGDAGMTPDGFRRMAHLKSGSPIDHDSANRALAGVLKNYQKQHRFEAEIKLESQSFSPNGLQANFRFTANRGPLVEVHVSGAKLSQDRIKKLLPLFEEGAVDDDLLNEGNRRLRDYFQRLGYFDVKADHLQQETSDGHILIQYNVHLGDRRRVSRVDVDGNHYFATPTLADLFSVHTANTLDRHGAYSQSLVAADVAAIEGLYRDNGFEKAKVRPDTRTTNGKAATLQVTYHVEEGLQTRVGIVTLAGNDHVSADQLSPHLNTVAGQLLSPQNLAGDRDALLTDYLSRGFDQVRVEVIQQRANDNLVNVLFRISEGQQIFVRKVLLRGPSHTRPATAAQAITLHPGDPLNQSALMESQRNLYEFGLFNEVETVVQNPTGDESYKTILIQATEARRWVVTYGFGFESQTGQPVTNCAGAYIAGVACNPNGKTGVSPRVLIDITRNGLFGREQSIALKGTYGLLEQNARLQYQSPHFDGNRDLGLTFTLGYANSQAVTTYVASKMEGAFRLTQHFSAENARLSKANTFTYELDFRRVKVDASSLQIYPAAITELSTARRVAGPQFSWLRDTRDSPLDAHSGSYTSFQEFFSSTRFGAEVNFNRVDLSSANYFGFLRGKMVLARNTRYAQERAYGAGNQSLIPLPERIYGGGPTSHRGFAINAAGPRDPETGFPIGGAGALINTTELRLPPPTLPWFGDTLSFVLFHDMGNVFTNAGDIWASALRISQPHPDTCMPSGQQTVNPIPDGPSTSTGKQGKCSFNYFSHAPGVGLRYHTPVGPIRLDFSYNLNPPVYPINIDYSAKPFIYSNQHLQRAKHFNFIFSLGQTF